MIDVLAVDGGQSTIRLGHSAIDDVVEVDGISRQEGDVVAAVAEGIGAGWRRLGSPTVQRAMLGLSTAPSDSDLAGRLCAMVSDATGASEVWLADDALTSGIGALSGRSGVSITAGTGVACLAVPAEEAPRIVGGYGHLLGDEGGGYWIGRRGLSAVLRALDERGPHTALTSRARARYGALEDLHIRIHDSPRAVDQIARFAPDVLGAAADGDVVASEIVDEAARELADVVQAGARLVARANIDVALGGRLLIEASELRSRVERLLEASIPGVCPRTADGSALEGCSVLGQQSDAGRYSSLVYTWRAQAAA